jgi:hypothetical protein
MNEVSLNFNAINNVPRNYSINKIALKNFRSDIIMKMLAITGKTFAEYKAKPYFETGITISGSDIMDTYTYRTASQEFKNEIEMISMSTIRREQVTASKTLGLGLKGASSFYPNEIESEQRAA